MGARLCASVSPPGTEVGSWLPAALSPRWEFLALRHPFLQPQAAEITGLLPPVPDVGDLAGDSKPQEYRHAEHLFPGERPGLQILCVEACS